MLCKSNRPHVSAQVYAGESLLGDDWPTPKLALQHLYHCVPLSFTTSNIRGSYCWACIASLSISDTCEGQPKASLLPTTTTTTHLPRQPLKAFNMTLSSTEGPQPIDIEPASPHNDADLEKLQLEEQTAVKKGLVIK